MPIRPRTPPSETSPAAPPPDAAPASPPPVEASPAPSADTISDGDLAAALELVKRDGATRESIRRGLGVSRERAASLLAEMEAKGIIGSAPRPGKKREILVTTWPPETAPVQKVDSEISEEVASYASDIIIHLLAGGEPSTEAFERELGLSKDDAETIMASLVNMGVISALTDGKHEVLIKPLTREEFTNTQKKIAGLSWDEIDERVAKREFTVIQVMAIDGMPGSVEKEDESEPSADERNELFNKAVENVIKAGEARLTTLAHGLVLTATQVKDFLAEMEHRGIIGPTRRGKPREILIKTWPAETAPDTKPELAKKTTPILTRAGGAAADLDNTKEAKPAPAEPPPAESTPPETPPAEPSPEETPPETPPTPPAPPETPHATPERSKWESITAGFRGAFDRFASKFRGEVQASDEKEYKASWGDVAKNAATGFLSVAASYTGVKILADLPQWLYQKYWTNPAERQRIKDALAAKETELGETTEPTAIDQKKAKLEEAINASKFLTKEKKAELLAKLHTTVEEYEAKDKTLRTERNEKIAKLLDQAIETRIKNTQILKEGLNSALMVTGLSAMRGVAYGAVAVYERHQEVMTSPERRMQYWKEMTYRGFTETAHNLIGGKADTWTGKGMNFVKGATNVLRAAGFADLAIAEWTTEGRSFSSVIETSLKAWEDKGAAAGWENIKAPWERLGHLGEYAKSAVTGSEPAPGATPETSGGAAGGGAPGSPEAATAAGTAGAAGVAAAESAPHVEVPEAQIEAGLVKKGDGILKILERQGVEGKSALEAAREAGIVRAAGDTRLTTEAIGRLSVFAEAKPEGGIEIKFFDTETDKVLTLAEAREAGFTYESGTVPGELATESEVAAHVAETAEILKDSADVPNDLLGGTFHLYADAEGNFTSIDVGDGDTLTRMKEALQELTRQGHGDSPEAKFIFEQYRQLLLTTEGAQVDDATPPPEGVEQATQRVTEQRTAESETSADGEPLRRFKGEAGKVKFVYDKETGAVKDAFLPAYTPGKAEISSSLREWGLTTKQVRNHFFEGSARTHMDGTAIDTSHAERYPEPNPTESRAGFPIQSPENDYRQLTREVTKLSRQESLLQEMEENGYRSTPEYARLKMETEQLERTLSRQMDRQFHIKERPI